MTETAFGPDVERHQLAAAYLSRVAEPACLPLWRFVRRVGYIAAAEAVKSGDVPQEVRTATESRRLSADPEIDLAAAEQQGIRLVTPMCDDWPFVAIAALERAGERRLVEITSARKRDAALPGRDAAMRDRDRPEPIPPLALWMRGSGDLSAMGYRSVAIVGSRAASAYGEHVATDLAFGLTERGVSVVSGGAFGIDAAAHRGALAAEGVTILVSAAGLDRPYPSAHRQLVDRVAENGLLVSERPPGSAPHRQRFLSRNRLIAAFGSATVLVEAAKRSGALNTAGYSRDIGRPVLAVPGPVTSAMSVGCHDEIRRDEDPARLVRGVADVLPYCGSLEMAIPGVDMPGEARDVDALDAPTRAVLDGFPARRVVTEAELARLSGQPIQVVLAALPMLMAHDLITTSREGYRLCSNRVAS